MSLEYFSLPTWLVDCTLQGSIAIALVIVIVPLVRRFLGAQAAYLLWSIVILRLLVPWLPATPLHWSTPSFRANDTHNALLLPGAKVSVITGVGKENASAASPIKVAEKSIVLPSAGRETTSQPWPWKGVALLIWLAGLTGILGSSIFRGVRAGRLAHRARDISDDPLFVGIFGSLASRVRIKQTGELRSPALTGVVRPTILLPLDWREKLSASQLTCVLAHELGHFHRGDLLWRWVFLFIRSVHWFNPLVWLAERIACADQEMACDEWVLLRDGTSDPQTYGEALIASAQKLSSQNFAFTIQAGMAESRAGLKRRIQHLTCIRHHGWQAIGLSLSLSALLVVLTGPARSEDAVTIGKNVETTSKTESPSPTPPEEQKASGDVKSSQKPRASLLKQATQVQIESKFVELPVDLVSKLMGNVDSKSPGATLSIRAIYNRKQFADLIRSLDQKKGVDLMSAPTVTTRSGQKCVINVIREFRYPIEFEQSADGKGSVIPTPSSFGTRNLGVTLVAEPTLTISGSIEMLLEPEVVDFDGFVNYGGSRAAKKDLNEDALKDTYQPSALGVINQPIFSARRVSTKIALHDGETIVLGGLTRDEVSKLIDNTTGKRLQDVHTMKALYVFVTATSIDREGHPISAGSASPRKSVVPSSVPVPLVKAGDNMFYGVAVPGKPGFVSSPYAPDAGYVDVRGFPVNTEVKDPYTGQMFLVPSPDGADMPAPLPDPASPLGKALRIMIPSVEFKNADLRDVMNSLKDKGVESDSESEPTKRGVNLVLKLPGKTTASRKITAKLTNISLFEALRFAAATNDLVVVGEPYALSIQPSEVGPLMTRTYQVPKPFLPGLQATKPSDLKSFWRAHGIDFPAGASVGYHVPADLVLRNTREEHEKLQKLFTQPPAYPVR